MHENTQTNIYMHENTHKQIYRCMKILIYKYKLINKVKTLINVHCFAAYKLKLIELERIACVCYVYIYIHKDTHEGRSHVYTVGNKAKKIKPATMATKMTYLCK